MSVSLRLAEKKSRVAALAFGTTLSFQSGRAPFFLSSVLSSFKQTSERNFNQWGWRGTRLNNTPKLNWSGAAGNERSHFLHLLFSWGDKKRRRSFSRRVYIHLYLLLPASGLSACRCLTTNESAWINVILINAARILKDSSSQITEKADNNRQ